MLVVGMLAALLPLGAAPATATTGDLVITGVVDGPLTGGVPKAIELYAVNAISDLSIYGLGSANNGGGSDGEEFTFPADSAAAGDFLYVATETTAFTSFFGFAPDYTSTSAASINGDDAIELFQSGSVIDVFGDINTDGTGQPWEYKDGWAYRVDGTGADGATFVLANWTFSGPDALDGETTNATAATPFPIGAYGDVAAPPTILINEVDADQSGTDAAEFVELYDGGVGNVPLDGLVIVLFNGSNDLSYASFDLDGHTTSVDGYFVVCGNAANVANCDLDVTPDTNLIQNGADAVALYSGDIADFPNGTAVTTDNLIDAIVYDTDDGDDPGLLALLNAGQPQVNERGGGSGTTQSNQRCPNGSGGTRNTDTYAQFAPTPGIENVCVAPPAEVFIHEIQGAGGDSPLEGDTVTIEGVVVADEETYNSLAGFFVQEENSDIDGDPATSEGIFVFNANNDTVDIGDVVRVTGTVQERYGNTQLGNYAEIEVLDVDPRVATPATVDFPLLSLGDLEAYEGMVVRFPQTLAITEYYNYDRYGEIVVGLPTPGADRPMNPTAVFEPGSAEGIALAEANALSRITIDDGSTAQNPDFNVHPIFRDEFTLSNAFRGGDAITGLTGAVYYTFGNYKLYPNAYDSYVPNERPGTTAADVGGRLRVASLNALNYFLTIDDGSGNCGPEFSDGCRGADSTAEFERQRAKLLAAIAGLDADVVGLVELENTPGVAPLADIVSGLNGMLGARTYDYIDVGVTGTDVIKVGVIYKPASVTPTGLPAILATPEFLDPNHTGKDRNRAALAVSFLEKRTGERFSVAVNHFKSKGSSCGEGDDSEYSGYCDLTRTMAAAELLEWIGTNPTNSKDGDWLILGDLNSYDKEAPIDTLRDGGYADLIDAYEGEFAYSYVFSGQWGYLDYALSSESLTGQVTGAAEWHVNADEPDIFNYDLSYKSPAQADLYAPDPYRSSDHDAVVVGLALNQKPGKGNHD